MMKTLLSLLFVATAVKAASTGEEECNAPPYGVAIKAHFEDGMVIKCSDADMLLMQKVLHAVISEDVLITGLDDFVPELYPYSEVYSSDSVIDHTGTLAHPPDASQILAHLEPEDEIEFEYYNEGQQVVITWPPSTSPSSGQPSSAPSLSPTDGPTPSPSSKPSSTPSLSPTDLPTPSPSDGPTPSPSDSPSESPSQSPTQSSDDRRLQELEALSNGYVMVPAGTFKDGGQPMELTHEEVESHHRNLQSGCANCHDPEDRPNWCCTFCPHLCRRRRALLEAVRNSIQPAPATSTANRNLREHSGQERRALYKLKHVFQEGETLESYTKKVRRMEKRITKKLNRKFRFLALAERVPCLGQFWKFDVVFDTELESFYESLFPQSTSA